MRYSIHTVTFLLILLRYSGDCKKTATSKLRRCTTENNKYYDPESRRCKRCPKCAVGWGLIHSDRDIKRQPKTKLPLTCYVCYQCTDGLYSENKDYWPCKSCQNCTWLGRLVVRVCDAAHNTRCGGCSPGFHDIYKKVTKVENTRRPCQECQHAEGFVADCETDPLRSTVKPADGVISLESPHNPSTLVHTTQNPRWPQPSPTSGSQNGVQQITGTPIQAEEPKELRPSTDGKLKQITLTGGIVLASLTVIFTVGYLGYLRIVPNQPNTTTTTASNGSPSRSETDTNQHRRDTVGTLETDVEPDSCSVGAVTPLLDRRQQYRLPSVHYKKRKFAKSNNSRTPEPAAICFPDKKLSLEQKMLLRDMGSAWPDLGRALGLKDAEIDCLREDYPRNQNEQIYQMIIRLERSNPEEMTVRNVYTALKSLDKDILSRKFLETVKMAEPNVTQTSIH